MLLISTERAKFELGGFGEVWTRVSLCVCVCVLVSLYMIHNREYISYYSASTALYNRITTILAYIADVPHQFSEWEVDTVLESDMGHAYVTPSNKGMTATDTQKNTVYYVAKQMKSYCTPEEFAIALARHFVRQYPLVFRAKVTVQLATWSRYSGQHHHGLRPGCGGCGGAQREGGQARHQRHG